MSYLFINYLIEKINPKTLLDSSLSPLITQTVKFATKLIEVGKFEDIKTEENYQAGQLFLHKIFAYRGVVLFPWMAKVYDHNLSNMQNNDNNPILDGQLINWQTQTYYQVLIDSRDTPFIRTQTEAVTFLGKEGSNRILYAVPGLDHVSHNDIMPYSSKEKIPINHELFTKFLWYDPNHKPSFVANNSLKVWQNRNRPGLDLSKVHLKTTENIKVTITPYYMGSRKKLHWWRYNIRIENLSKKTVQLRERHLRIVSSNGALERLRGRGIIGVEPILSLTSPAFQYSAHVHLPTSSGHLWGTFKMKCEDGSSFHVHLPPVPLEGKGDGVNPPLFGI